MLRARLTIDRVKPGEIAVLNALARSEAARASKTECPNKAIMRVAFIIGFLGRRLPWRSDCLIQALAGQKWLTRLGISSEVRVGVEKRDDGTLDAHAWLVSAEETVCGGEISKYSVLIGETTSSAP